MRSRARRLLLPLDGSKSAEAAFEFGRELVQKNQGELLLLSVLEFSIASGLSAGNFLHRYWREVARRREYLRSLISRLQEAVPARDLVLWGTPARRILEAARDLEADLIVLTCDQRRKRSRLAKAVQRVAPTEVLLLARGGAPQKPLTEPSPL